MYVRQKKSYKAILKCYYSNSKLLFLLPSRQNKVIRSVFINIYFCYISTDKSSTLYFVGSYLFSYRFKDFNLYCQNKLLQQLPFWMDISFDITINLCLDNGRFESMVNNIFIHAFNTNCINKCVYRTQNCACHSIHHF